MTQHTNTKKKRKCLNDSRYDIFFKSRGFKDIKYDIQKLSPGICGPRPWLFVGVDYFSGDTIFHWSSVWFWVKLWVICTSCPLFSFWGVGAKAYLFFKKSYFLAGGGTLYLILLCLYFTLSEHIYENISNVPAAKHMSSLLLISILKESQIWFLGHRSQSTFLCSYFSPLSKPALIQRTAWSCWCIL